MRASALLNYCENNNQLITIKQWIVYKVGCYLQDYEHFKLNNKSRDIARSRVPITHATFAY